MEANKTADKAAPKKKAPPKNKSADNNIITEDIPHTEVANDQTPTVRIAGKEVTIQDEIQNQIAKFGIADAGIAKLKEEYGALVILDDKDKEGYEAVKKAWNDVRSKRTGLEKKGLDLRNGYNVIGKAIKGEEDRLIKLITPLEDDLYEKWKAIDQAKEAEKQRIKDEEERRLMGRVEDLLANGMILRDGFYQLGDTISMDVATLRAMPDDQYNKLLGVVKARKKELDELAKLKLEEENRQKEQQRQEQEKLREEQEKLRQQQEDLRKQQQELEDQKREAALARRQMRLATITRAGFVAVQGGQYQYSTPIMRTPIIILQDHLELPEAEFNDMMKLRESEVEKSNKEYQDHLTEENRKKELEEKQKEEVRIAREKKEHYIAQALEGAGMTFFKSRGFFNFTNQVTDFDVDIASLIELEEADITAKAKEIGKRIQTAIEVERQQVADRKKKEEEDRQANLTDTQLIKEYVAALKAVPKPDAKKIKTAGAKARMVRITDFLKEIDIK